MLSAVLLPVPAGVSAAPAPVKEWTVMVYMSAKNNLELYGLKDLNEMEKVGSTGELNIVAEFGRMAGHDSSDGDWRGVRRYLVQKDDTNVAVTSPVLADLGAADMGDYRSLAAFGTWAKANFPAKKYMLVVWDHGSGWSDRAAGSKAISYDEETGSHINTPQLARALAEMGGVDLLATDACLMQMAEVAAELAPHAAFIAGSQETAPMDGYPYHLLLEPLAANPGMSPEKLGGLLVKESARYYERANQNFTQSLLDASVMPDLRSAADAFALELMRSGEKALAKKARDSAKSFTDEENKDLYDFARRVEDGAASPALKAAASTLMNVISYDLVLDSAWAGEVSSEGVTDYDDAYGLAVFLPEGAPPKAYSELAWSAGSWDELLAWLAAP